MLTVDCLLQDSRALDAMDPLSIHVKGMTLRKSVNLRCFPRAVEVSFAGILSYFEAEAQFVSRPR